MAHTQSMLDEYTRKKHRIYAKQNRQKSLKFIRLNKTES